MCAVHTCRYAELLVYKTDHLLQYEHKAHSAQYTTGQLNYNPRRMRHRVSTCVCVCVCVCVYVSVTVLAATYLLYTLYVQSEVIQSFL